LIALSFPLKAYRVCYILARCHSYLRFIGNMLFCLWFCFHLLINDNSYTKSGALVSLRIWSFIYPPCIDSDDNQMGVFDRGRRRRILKMNWIYPNVLEFFCPMECAACDGVNGFGRIRAAERRGCNSWIFFHGSLPPKRVKVGHVNWILKLRDVLKFQMRNTSIALRWTTHKGKYLNKGLTNFLGLIPCFLMRFLRNPMQMQLKLTHKNSFSEGWSSFTHFLVPLSRI